MYCLSCKKVYPDTEDKCPHCGASPFPERCPECYAKLWDGENVCKKCGCDIKRYIKEKEDMANYVAPTFKDKIKSLPSYVKIAVPVLIIALVLAAASIIGYVNYSVRAEAQKHSKDLIVRAEASMDMITEIALYYEDDVYNRDWISHIENAEKLREKHADKIKAIDSAREPVTYAAELVFDSGDKKLASLASDVYYAYTSCYSYVISEKGKYPHYLDNYNKLLDKYETAVKKLKEEIE